MRKALVQFNCAHLAVTMPIRIVDDCCGLGTASTALQLALKRDDFKIVKVEASENDFCLRHWIKGNLGFKRVIKDCNDKRRFLETGNGRKKKKRSHIHIRVCVSTMVHCRKQPWIGWLTQLYPDMLPRVRKDSKTSNLRSRKCQELRRPKALAREEQADEAAQAP